MCSLKNRITKEKGNFTKDSLGGMRQILGKSEVAS